MPKLKLILLLILILILVAIFYAFKPEPVSKINLVMMEGPVHFPIPWAIENNLIKIPENVELYFIPVPTASSMFVSSEADIGIVTFTSFVQAWSANNDWKIVYPYGKYIDYVCTNKESNITAQDLKGKVIAVPNLKGTTTLQMLDILEKKYNITLDEITLTQQHTAAVPILVEEGEVDAGIMIGRRIPNITERFNVLFGLGEEFEKLYGDYPVTSVIAAKKDIDKKTVKEIVSSFNYSLELALDDIDSVSQLYYDKYMVNITQELENVRTEGFNIVDPWTENKKAVLQREFELVKEHGIVEEIPELEEVLMIID